MVITEDMIFYKPNKELIQNMELLFGKDFEYLSTDDMMYIFDKMRFKLREAYLRGFPDEWKACDKCYSTFHKHTLSCLKCGNAKLRDFKVDPNPYFQDILRELSPSTETRRF